MFLHKIKQLSKTYFIVKKLVLIKNEKQFISQLLSWAIFM
jgi:hypothetical protein